MKKGIDSVHKNMITVTSRKKIINELIVFIR